MILFLKKLSLFFAIFFSISFMQTFAEVQSTVLPGGKRVLMGVRYFKEMMGNVHQNPSRYSQVMTTISCNHPVKVMKEISRDGKEISLFGDNDWHLVTVGPYEGYIPSDFLTENKNTCFSEEYPKYFDGLELSISDLYYWARLNDLYLQGKTKVK